jgi:hypothetical protein
MADINPNNKGNEVYYCREGWGKEDDSIGMAVFNDHGELLWGRWGYTHVDGGWVARIVPGSPGMQCFGYDLREKSWEEEGVKFIDAIGYIWDYDGSLIAKVNQNWIESFPIDWDGDTIKEICLNNGMLVNYKNEMVEEFEGSPLWGADLFGDHREELVITKEGRKVLIIFNVDGIESKIKSASIEDRQYLNDLSRTAMQGRVIPMESGYKYTLNSNEGR